MACHSPNPSWSLQNGGCGCSGMLHLGGHHEFALGCLHADSDLLVSKGCKRGRRWVSQAGYCCYGLRKAGQQTLVTRNISYPSVQSLIHRTKILQQCDQTKVTWVCRRRNRGHRSNLAAVGSGAHTVMGIRDGIHPHSTAGNIIHGTTRGPLMTTHCTAAD